MIKTFFGGVASVLKWLVFILILWVGKAAAVLISPVAAMFVETDAQGKPQLQWRWVGTHDAPADEWWRGGYYKKSKIAPYLTQELYDNSVIIQWLCRVCWICRNPAYALAHSLGYDQRGMVIHTERDEDVLWDTGKPNFSFWWATNAQGQIGWMLEWQYYFYKKHCLEVYLGWKLHRNDPDKRCMIVGRITPFKSYG